jgi:hypothetical protein
MKFRFENNYETEIQFEQTDVKEMRFEQPSMPQFRIVNMAAWFEWLKSLMCFLWVGNIDHNHLLSILDWRYITISGKDFASSFIPSISAATFTLPNDADYIAADLDGFWFAGGVSKILTVGDLANCMLSRTLILYNNAPPFNVYAIGILKDTTILNNIQREQLGHDFQLWLFYSEII